MRKIASCVAGLSLAAVFVHQGSCLAAGKSGSEDSAPVLSALAGMAVSTAELGQQQARGISLGDAVSEASVTANRVGSGSITGPIGNTNSINNNVGITTVFQNSGNNSLFQNSTSIFITVH